MPATRKPLATLLAGAALLALTIWVWQSQTARAAPDVTFQTLKSGRVALAQFRGQPVLVSFWATSCASCLEELPHLVELYRELHPAGLEMVSVAMAYDPPNHVLEFSEAANLPHHIALDIDYAIADAFGDVRLTPTTFLLDPEGKIVLRQLGKLDLDATRAQIKTYL